MATNNNTHSLGEPRVTSEPIAVRAPQDPLWGDVLLDYRTQVSLFGITLTIESNSPSAAPLVAIALGIVDAPPRPDELVGDGHIRLRLIIEPTRVELPFEPLQWRQLDADHLLIRGPGLVGFLDFATSESVIYVEEYRVREGALFRDTVVRGPTLYLTNRLDRHPIHAAALRRGDAALILQGRSGAGKSTLCYAASRAGVSVLSDDAVRVQCGSEVRFWGSPGHVNLLDAARINFPELRDRDSSRMMASGKVKHVIALSPNGVAEPSFARRARVCLLNPVRGRVAREEASADEVAHTILSSPEVRGDLYPSGRGRAVAALAARGGWKLTLSNDPNEAVPFLLEMLAEV